MLNTLNIAFLGFFIWSGGATIESYVPVSAIPIEYSVRLTGYNAVPEQTDSDPHVTAAGIRSNPEIVAARSRDLAQSLPFGTIIELTAPKDARSCGFKQVEPLVGYRVIADTMHARKRAQVDLLFGTDEAVKVGKRSVNPALAVGVCEVTARVVGRLSMKEIPSTQAELAVLVKREFALR
ncbi:MAG: hypothetical protein Q8Q36_02870 [bacterium]|nr:hypothetical protein [bacterium]